MTTPGPESDPYAAPDSDPYAATERHDWRYQPVVPSWSAGQDWNAGPQYDDTGWQIDLSNVDWGADAGPRQREDRPRRRGAPSQYEDLQDGNGVRPAYRRPRRPAGPPPARPERQTGRRGRHARPVDEQYAPPRPDEQYAPPRPDEQYAPPRRDQRRAPPRRDQGYAPSRPDEQYAPPRRPDPSWDRPVGPPPTRSRPDGYSQPSQPSYPPSAQPGYRPAPPAGYRTPGYRKPRPDAGSASIVKSSGVMAVGTLGSRLTGFLRTIAQSYALGLGGIATAYNLSNTLPNVVYNLALGGILTSVIVPLIVNASRRDADRGEAYDQRMFTLVTLALLGVTVVATVLAVPIVHLYSGSSITKHPPTLHLAIIFALFFIPQIFFYGVSSLIGAILNSRGSFAAPMWTPIINNFVVIAILGMYVVVTGHHFRTATPSSISGFEIKLLGFGTTLGIIAQTIALIPALRQVGFRWRPQTDFRRREVAEIGRMAGWMFGYIAATQIAFLVTTKVATDVPQGINDYNYAWLLFQLPYAVVGISVITALLPRMSAHASAGRLSLIREDFSAGVRLSSTIVVPCSLVLAVLGPKLGELFFAHGATHVAGGHDIGVVFSVFSLGLLPYMIFQLQLRVFYSLHDSKTPAIIGLVTMAVNILANVIALDALPTGHVVAGLAAGFGVANVVGLAISWRILSVRLRGLDGRHICRTLVRMHAAALPAALLAILVGLITSNALVNVIIGGGLGFGIYLMFARALRIEELSSVSATMLARVGR
ncbi:MAG TPA: murein biosynthesis integral membrane protein MurJ [Streptosporangiaceae bacterium]|nr:murein biosynthesis integral membrane protein MurJ [Streptosporangiaceae bacterium]